jgi:hypothetical protein
MGAGSFTRTTSANFYVHYKQLNEREEGEAVYLMSLTLSANIK